MVKVTQHSWLGGVLDRELMGRQDLDRYASGASRIVNFLPQRRGSLAKRPGTDFVASLAGFVGANTPFRMIPFGYKSDDGRVLVVKSGAMKVYGRNGFVADVTGTIPSYTADELNSLCPAQCGDVLYLAQQNHPPAEVRHTTDAEYSFRNCPVNAATTSPKITGFSFRRKYFNPENYQKGRNAYDVKPSGTDATYLSGAASVSYCASVVDSDGNESVLASYASDHVTDVIIASDSENKKSYNVLTVRYYAPWTDSQVIEVTAKTGLASFKELRLYKDSGGTFGLIGVASKNQCKSGSYTFRDDNISPDTSVSPLEAKTVFNAEGKYPAAVAVYQQRLVWASSKEDPARVWMSATGDLYQNRPHVTIQPDDPIDFILPITRFAKINFIVELRKLLMFSEACEWLVSSNSTSEGVAYDTIQATPHSYIGCDARLPPIVANTNILFAERTGRAVRSYGYQLEDDGFGGTDISVFSASVFAGKRIVDWTYQQHPQPTIWCVMDDGTLVSAVYMPEQQICAWSTHVLGGGGRARAIACTWAIEGDTSSVLVAVERDGVVALEAFRRPQQERTTLAESVCMDSVRVVQDASTLPEGMWSIARPEGGFIAGWRFTSSFTSVYPSISDERVGAAQFDVRTVQDVALRLRMGVGGNVRAAQADQSLAVPLTRTTAPSAESDGVIEWPQVDERVVVSGVNDGDGRVTVEQDDAGPFEIVLMETDIDIEIPTEDAG